LKAQRAAVRLLHKEADKGETTKIDTSAVSGRAQHRPARYPAGALGHPVLWL